MRPAILSAFLPAVLALAPVPAPAAEGAGFAPAAPAPAGAPARVEWSDGRRAAVVLGARPGLALQFLPDGAARRERVLWSEVRELRLEPLKEGMEKIWRWKEGGSDEKIYTGQSYPWRQYAVVITTADGRSRRGRLAAGFALNATADGTAEQLVISPRHKGEAGQTLEQLVYVRCITVGDAASAAAPAAPAP